VFDPGLGQVRAGFLFSRYVAAFSNGKPVSTLPENAGWVQFSRYQRPRKNNQREKNPAPDAGLIAAHGPESRQTGPKMARK
jgi:hypothetical protein